MNAKKIRVNPFNPFNPCTIFLRNIANKNFVTLQL
jgi:hypothetical protein